MSSEIVTKIIDLLVEGKLAEATEIYQNQIFTSSAADSLLIQYLLLLVENSEKAIKYWEEIDTRLIDEPFLTIISDYNRFKSKKIELLKNKIIHLDISKIQHLIEAENLAYFAHQFKMQEANIILQRVKELDFKSELLQAEETDGMYRLYSPLVLTQIHYHVIQFLDEHFKTEKELQDFLHKMNFKRPL